MYFKKTFILIIILIMSFSAHLFSITFLEKPKKIISLNDDIYIASGADIYKFNNELSNNSKIRLKGHSDYVIDLAALNDNSRLFSASWDKTIREWNLSTKKSHTIYRTSSNPKMIKINPQQNIIAILEKKVILYNLTTNKEIISKDFKRATAICWNNAGTNLAIGNDKGNILFWDWKNDNVKNKLKKHNSSISELMYNPKGDLLLSTDKEGMLYVWNALSFEIIKKINTISPIYSLHITSDGYFAFIGTKLGYIKIIDLEKSKTIKSISKTGRILTLSTSKNGKYLYAGSSNKTVYKIRLDKILEIQEKRDLPCNIAINALFNDNNTYFPNNLLEATEQGELAINISNSGNRIGTAYNTHLIFSCDNPHISIISEKELGDIVPAKSKEVTIPIKCDLNAIDGKATITIKAKEKRGYDAQPVKIVIPVQHIEKPELLISEVTINDANLGLAKGNGNDIPENGETIELVAYIKNTGKGVALGTTFDLKNVTQEINIITDHIDIGRIEAGTTEKAKVVVQIPREFSEKSFKYQFVVNEIRGACSSTTKNGSFSIGKLSPLLAYSFTPPNNLENGNSGNITIKVSNNGQLDASGVKLKISETEPDITLENDFLDIGTLQKGKSGIPLITTINVQRTYTKPTLSLLIELSQDGTDFNQINETKIISINLIKPDLQIVDRSNLNKEVMQNTISAELILAVENTGKLNAENVQISVYTSTDNIRFRKNKASIGTVLASASSDIEKFIFDVPQGVVAGEFPIQINVTQKDFPPVGKILNYTIKERGALITTVEPDKQNKLIPISNDSGNQSSEIISNLNDNQIIYSSILPISVSVFDNDGISSVRINLNGINIFNSQTDQSARKSDKSIQYNTSRTDIIEGENVIEIFAEDNQNIREKKTINIIYKRTEGLVTNLEPPFSDVDIDLPKGKSNPNSAALIIGIENYQNISPALYASRDAISFREYCIQTLGISEENIVFLINEKATLGQMRKGMLDLKRRVSGGNVFVFFSGHGIPDQNGNAYIVPQDGDVDDPEALKYVCYPMQEFYKNLDDLDANHVTIFVDACFSGNDQNDNAIIAYAKPVIPTIDPTKTGFASGKITQLNSSTGSQFSTVYDEKRHGVFSYFLLKGLKGFSDVDKNGKLSFDELSSYVSEKVTKQVRLSGRGEQTPTANGQNQKYFIVEY